MASLASQHGFGGDGRRVRLTKNDRLVLTALEQADAPLKAYDLLERLKEQGIGAPMTVYRALDRLQKQGLVHKIDGLGAFMVCKHGEPHQVETFLIFRRCENVDEVRNNGASLDQLVQEATENTGFEANLVRVEIRGLCANCNQ